jgi:hypothetical protein
MTKVGYSPAILFSLTITLTNYSCAGNTNFLSWVRAMNILRHENIPVRIALSLRQQAEEIARQQNTSLNHWVTQALEEKIVRMSAQSKILHMHERAQQIMPESMRSAG